MSRDMNEYEFSDRNVRKLHNALSLYRSELKDSGRSAAADRAEKLRRKIVNGSGLRRECLRLVRP